MGNPFISAYLQSDGLGKSIFLGLFLLSALSWTILLHKSWIFIQVRRLSSTFSRLFSEKEPLSLQSTRPLQGKWVEVPHPFFEIYKTFKHRALAMIHRNHFFAPQSETCLSEADLRLLESDMQATISSQVKQLDKNLFILSTVVTLAPFLGLLGTVWGILLTFSQLHAKGLSAASTAMLSGLSLALATTVLGLIVAIPALVGHNFLKNKEREVRRDMEDFAHLLLSSVELQYRKPDHAPKTPSFS